MNTLILTARDILQANPEAILSGSLALHLQNWPNRRPPTDIDLVIGSTFSFMPLPGQTLECREGATDYEDAKRRSYILRFGVETIKIDVFQLAPAAFAEQMIVSKDGLRLHAPKLILAAKLSYSLDERSGEATRVKHQLDLIHLLTRVP